MVAADIAAVVRMHEETVRRWLVRFRAAGLEGLKDAPRPGAPARMTRGHRDALIALVRRRPRALGPPFSLWTGERLADSLAERTAIRASRTSVYRLVNAGGIRLHRPQHAITSSDPEYALTKRRWSAPAAGEARRGVLLRRRVAQFTNISWHPTIRALCSPRGQQVMIPTPVQPTRRYGLGAANRHTGGTVVLARRRKRRREVAELLQTLVDKHPHERVYVAWDNSGTHQDDEVEAVLWAAAGRSVLLYLPTYSPWLNPITRDFFDRYTQRAGGVRSTLGAHPV